MNFFDDASSGSRIPFDLKFEWAVRDGFLGEKTAVGNEVRKEKAARGEPLRGHPVQTYSYMKNAIRNGIETQDVEILHLCSVWGIDPTLPLNKQERSKIKAAWERIKQERDSQQVQSQQG